LSTQCVETQPESLGIVVDGYHDRHERIGLGQDARGHAGFVKSFDGPILAHPRQRFQINVTHPVLSCVPSAPTRSTDRRRMTISHKTTMRRPPSRQFFRPKSPFLAWPPFFTAPPFSLHGFLHGLELSQWEPPAQLASGQRAQLRLLLEWAVNHVPYYRKARGHADILAILRRHPDDFERAWTQLPILTKAELRASGSSLVAPSLPPGHEPVTTTRTSGSTGIPVEVRSTALTRTIWDAVTIRDQLWHRRDFSKRLGTIRALTQPLRKPGGTDYPNWGSFLAPMFSSGPASIIHVGYPIQELAAWLKRFDPHYVMTYPSVAAALVDELGDDRPPSLEEFRMFAEPLDPELVQRLRTQWDVRCADVYSANEVGYIALECPEHRRLHVQSESLFVEILDESGNACGAGDTGRVVFTALHNLAMPLLRYEVGDYATLGAPCACGRGSPVLERVRGRVRNMARTPDGQRFYPPNLGAIRGIAPIRQAQFVQSATDCIDLRVVLDRPLTDAETAQTIDFVRRALGFPFKVSVVSVDTIERGPTGKFEEFLSLVPAASV
jgi:phenylacetate-CoA ligase